MSDSTLDRTQVVARKPSSRSRLSNGRDVIAGVDKRSAIARRYRDIIEAISSDQGGDSRLSETRRQLVRRLAGAAVLAECLETKIANGLEVNVAEYATLTSTMVRVAQRLGIDHRRIPKDITPDPLEYAREFEASDEAV